MAQHNLGLLLYKGLGVKQNHVTAYMRFDIARSLGHRPALDARRLIEKDMTAEQITEAQKMARECVANNLKGC